MNAFLRRLRRAPLQREHGQVLVLAAMALTLMVGMAGLAVDGGKVLYTRTDVQKVADAAAFAGAQNLPSSTTQARTAAELYVTKNSASSTAPTITFSTTAATNDTITVAVRRTISMTFMRGLGVTSKSITARAKVQAAVVTGYSFDDPDVFPYAVWGGNPNYPGCSVAYGLCPGASKIFRSNSYDNQVTNSVKGSGKAWDVSGNNFKGRFNYSSGSTIYLNPTVKQTFANGGNANGQEGVSAELQSAYDRGRPIILPVISTAQCGNGDGVCSNSSNLQFTIVAWVCLKVTNLNSNGGNWTGAIQADCIVPGGETGGGNQPPAGTPVTRVLKLLE
ncbi:MAG: pilus assembly protein TadG-related protein [Tepidiformaceae bacterium]